MNADEKNIKLSAEFLASLPRHPEIINLLPYHDIGKGKHAKLGSIYNPKGYKMQTPSEEVQQQCIQILRYQIIFLITQLCKLTITLQLIIIDKILKAFLRFPTIY